MENKYEGYINPTDGEIDFPNEVERRMFYTFLTNFEGKNLWIEVRSKSPTRSNRQNRFYWVYLEEIAEQTGYSTHELHNHFKHELLNWMTVPGIGQSYVEAPTTGQLNKQEFNNYIKEIEMLTEIQAPSKARYNLN